MNRTASLLSFKKVLLLTTVAAASVALLASLVTLMNRSAAAADHTVNPGQSIQSAINAANDGDTVIISAGEYNEYITIRKPLTLRGVGGVVIKTRTTDSVPRGTKGLDLQNTSNVTVENITFDGENNTPVSQTGIDINSARNVVLRNVTVQNYAKNGIAVTTQAAPTAQVSEYQAGGNVTFNNVTVRNAAWAGIAFYSGIAEPMTGVQFAGTTTIADTQYGLQLGDSNNAGTVTGANGATLALGHVVFSGNNANISNNQTDARLTIADTSTVNGNDVTSTSFPGVEVTLIAVDSTVPESDPNTGSAS